MEISTFITRDPVLLQKVFSFRYEIFVEEFGVNFSSEVREAKALKDSFDDIAYHYVSIKDDKIVGVLRAFDLSDVPDHKELKAKYKLQPVIHRFVRCQIAFTGRLLVARECRKGSVAMTLMAMATDDGRRRGIRFAFVDCSPRLLPFYEPCGFRRYAPGFNDAMYGYKIPLIFLSRDAKGLRATRSPLEGRDYEDDREARDWYRSNYASYTSPQTATLQQPDQFAALIRERMGIEVNTGIPLFSGLSPYELTRMLRRSTIIQAKTNDVIFDRKTLQEEFLTVILSGSLLVCKRYEEGLVDQIVGKGEHTGLVTCLDIQSWKITVNRDCELLMFCGDYLAHLVEKDKGIRAKLTHNIRSIVSAAEIKAIDSRAAHF